MGDRLTEAPIGARAPAIMGGHWYMTESGWKWNGPDGSGSTFPNPGGDWTSVLIEPGAVDPFEWNGAASPSDAPTSDR
ncbi:hypothetical protein [Methylobacterium sp. 092160098-2]|uniref:hypothetical protein n=1 Tax=Methylobacterium sp. 092160098-2 TaxID=3025129 RepID=UPI002381A755|nr:hypothetical protein [Methylobacterium sp. 092160098-2]MDE4914817.1 hypothetical protein [Methylobacterium sp. 092160098-2]